MKPLILIFAFLAVSACCIDDDDIDRTGGNTFYAVFNEQVIKPERIHGFGYGSYTLVVHRSRENNKNWRITVNSNNHLTITLYILNINDIGSYSIETANLEDWTRYSKTRIFLRDDITAQFKALSLGNTGSFEVTKYDSERGILEASFSCDMYDPQHPEIIKPISGNFKINLETHPNYN